MDGKKNRAGASNAAGIAATVLGGASGAFPEPAVSICSMWRA